MEFVISQRIRFSSFGRRERRIINFTDPPKESETGKRVIQVKGAQSVNPSIVSELNG
jgi:hypothetical protein